jgi:hypothetical protein
VKPFSVKDLPILAQKNLGLRLTDNENESKFGGFGDAIPISHLAGANDIIEFMTLSFLPELPKISLKAIYEQYRETDVRSSDCMPRIILHYAAKHDIGDARERLSYKKDDNRKDDYKLHVEEIEKEAKSLVSFYSVLLFVYPLELVVDKLPYLAQELAYNFNEKIKLRLTKNWNLYANNDDMNYLLLTDDFQRYKLGYDFNHYPLGKTGNHRFNYSNVVKKISFLGGEHRTFAFKESLEKQIFNAITFILKLDSMLQNIELTLSQQVNYSQDLKNAFNNMVVLIIKLQEKKQLLPKECIDLLKNTADLIDNPAEYKKFLTKAKSYRLIDEGWLTAYMMLIVGYIAKVMTCNYLGDAWINYANEKIDNLTTIAACSDKSEAYVNSMRL